MNYHESTKEEKHEIITTPKQYNTEFPEFTHTLPTQPVIWSNPELQSITPQYKEIDDFFKDLLKTTNNEEHEEIENLNLTETNQHTKHPASLSTRVNPEDYDPTTTNPAAIIKQTEEEKEDEIFYKTNIVAPKSLNGLQLTSIVIHDGINHYTCYFKCNNKWFYYDDTKNEQYRIVPVGKYKNLFSTQNTNPKPSRFGTLFFYY